MAQGDSLAEALASKGIAAAPFVLLVGPQSRRDIHANGLWGGTQLRYEGTCT